MRRLGRIRDWLAGDDGPGRRSPPLGELLAPGPLVALLVLAVNDRLLKGRGVVPGWITGKLSDVAGLLFFPLLLTAVVDTILWATPFQVDFSLRRAKLGAAVVGTGLFFTLLKLWPAWAQAFDQLLGGIGFRAHTVSDPSDLAALPMLAVAWLLGTAEIRRVPRGRLEAVARGYRGGGEAEVRAWLVDTRDDGDGRLARSVAAWLDAPGEETARAAREALAAVRQRP